MTLGSPIPPQTLRLMSIWGWSICAVWAGVLIAWGIVKPDPYAQGWRLVLEQAFLGPAVNIADGITNGFSEWYLLVQSGPQDPILVLILFPWVVFGYERLAHVRFLGAFLRNVRRTARYYMRRVEPYGVIGLFLFVMFPFWSTGALVGSVLAYFLGMRLRVILPTVFSGYVASVIALIWFFDLLEAIAKPFSQGLANFLPWFVVAILFAVGFYLHRNLPPEVDE